MDREIGPCLRAFQQSVSDGYHSRHIATFRDEWNWETPSMAERRKSYTKPMNRPAVTIAAQRSMEIAPMAFATAGRDG